MSVGIAKLDIETINMFQRELHEPNDDNEEMISTFYR